MLWVQTQIENKCTTVILIEHFDIVYKQNDFIQQLLIYRILKDEPNFRSPITRIIQLTIKWAHRSIWEFVTRSAQNSK